MEHDRSLTCEQLVGVLDAYLDASERPEDRHLRAAVDAHLARCPDCPALVADVRTIRTAARTLEPMAPPEHVWRQVRARVSLDAPPRVSWLDRFGWRSMSEPLAALAVLVLLVGSLTWIGVRLTDTPAVQTADASGTSAEFQLAEAEYADAIERLEEAAEAAGPRLDALTGATLESSIHDIDTAIGDAREALALAPDDAVSQESLLDALGSKVALLQDTVALLGDLEPATEEQTP
jgi:anti-sigma factor RsiW